MAQQVALKAVTGRELGTSSSRRLRRDGRIPGVVYGMKSEPLPISIDYAEARVALSTEAGLNALLNLEVDGNAELCLVKDLQRHVVRDEVTHIDFLRVDPNAEIELEVPLVLVGEARAVLNVDGMVDQSMFAVTIATLPTSIPNEIEADVSDMEVGDSLRIEDLVLPSGVRAVHGPDETVATAMVTRSTLEAMREDEEAEAEAEEAEFATGDEGDEEADADGDDD